MPMFRKKPIVIEERELTMEAFTDKLSNGQYAAFMIATGLFIGLPIMAAFVALFGFGPVLVALL